MDFNEILKSSLAVVNDNYQLALKDIQEVVDSVHTAVQNNAGEKYGVTLSSTSVDVKGSTFRIYFDTNLENMRSRVIDVLFVRIPSGGYPVAVGTVDKATKKFYTEETVNNKDELNKYFTQFLKNPESSLIQAIGFALRNQDDEEDIPF